MCELVHSAYGESECPCSCPVLAGNIAGEVSSTAAGLPFEWSDGLWHIVTPSKVSHSWAHRSRCAKGIGNRLPRPGGFQQASPRLPVKSFGRPCPTVSRSWGRGAEHSSGPARPGLAMHSSPMSPNRTRTCNHGQCLGDSVLGGTLAGQRAVGGCTVQAKGGQGAKSQPFMQRPGGNEQMHVALALDVGA